MVKAKRFLNSGMVGLVVSISPGVPIASAQNGPTPSPAESDTTIPAIVVTAQKREQNLQDVPIVVTVASKQLLQDTGVKDIKDLTLLIPGLIVTSTSSDAITTARIRGIGTVGDNPGLESSVGVMIDGVYRPRNGVGFGDLGELERIEVIKGPQGTLYGKNTSAGVINILTRQPEFNFRTNIELSTGDYGAKEGSASVTGPLMANKVAGRLYFTGQKRDGFYRVNTANGPRTLDEDSNQDFYGLRGQLLFLPSDAIDIHLTGDYTDRTESCCTAVQTNVGATAAIINVLSADSGVANPADPFARRAFSNRPTPQNVKDRGVSAQINWKLEALGNATLTSISAWRDWNFVGGIDADYSTADILFRASDGRYGNDFKQATEELRLAGQTQRLNWMIGAFYAQEKLESRYHLAYGSAFEPYYSLLFSQGTMPGLVSSITGRAPGTAYPLDAGLLDRFNQTSDSYALLTHNTLSITDHLEATIGLRYTDEKKRLNSSFSNINGGSAGCAASRTRRTVVDAVFSTAPPGTAANWYNFGCSTFADPAFDTFASRQDIDGGEWSGTAKLAYRFSAELMTYLSYARGYKAAGFNFDRERIVDPVLGASDPASRGDADTTFAPETADSYEIGAKADWLDSRLLLNGALFYQRFKDFQLNTFTGLNYIVASVPEVTSKGVDIDFLWHTPLPTLMFQGGLTYSETDYGNFTPGLGVPARLPGNQVSFAPRWSGSLSAAYSHRISEKLQWRANVGAKVTSSYNTGSDLNPVKEQAGFALLNARVGVGTQDGHWAVEAWAQNLTDKDYYQVVIDAPLQSGTYDAWLGQPRTYGVTLRMSF